MRPYKITVYITTRWKIEIHANDETEAQQIGESLEPGGIELNGDFQEDHSVEVVDVEEILGKEEE